MAFHGFVHVHGVHTRGVEAGEPHIAHDNYSQRVGGVFETLLQPFFDLAAVDMGLQQGLVGGRASHDDFDGSLFRVGIVPVGSLLDDFVVKVNADVTAHGHHHGFAILRLAAFLEVLHQVGGHAGHSRSGTHHLLQCSPSTFELSLCIFLFILGEFVHLFIELGQVFFFQAQLSQTTFVIDGNRSPVFLRLLHVIDMDVIAKHSASVAVGAVDRGASEGHKGGLWQGITQVLGISGLVGLRARLTFEFSLKAILGTVGLVGNNHYVPTLGKHRKHILVLARHEFLDGGKHNTARWPVAE